ncbi:TetR/AcrR family transcriptional regulator [Leptospira stimsonii]|uniref:AcrR family transcriptional regulator n=1 Tax=Leptospira stimsonii TaxID=2202203 RepID=A0A8B3CNW6_9LEPT|nr:TetR/AcrR family transcriptional regulator [Leptospira stimsonii]RHX83826.1 AcrR family transcriptional regulator [Leptospira stimsonii]
MSEKGSVSKERMVRAMALSLETRGYNGTGLNEIVALSKSPKGSIYFHFPGGKEDLAAQAITTSGRELGAMLRSLLESSKTTASGIGAIFKALERKLIETDFSQGCPVATTASETASYSNPVSEACKTVFAEWKEEFEEFFIRTGWERKKASELAISILCLLEGAILLSRTNRSSDPMKSAAKSAKILIQQGES